MININSFGVIGGDRRQAALAESIANDGYSVYAWGFDRLPLEETVRQATLEEIAEKCMVIILPLPVTADGSTLNAPYAEEELILDDSFAALMRHREVYGGQIGKLLSTSEYWNIMDVNDYFTREEFTVRNAAATAEGAVEIAMREYDRTICGSRCLVTGFGRIGKALAWALRGLGASVSVSARKPADLARIEVYGYTPVKSDEICRGENYDIIFNTVPAMVFSESVLSRIHSSTLMIDLASMPGGIDFDAARKRGLRTVHALSLPGKTAPRAAGEIIKNTIYTMMEE